MQAGTVFFEAESMQYGGVTWLPDDGGWPPHPESDPLRGRSAR